MMWIIMAPNIWVGASYPYVIAIFQVGRSEGRGEKREAVPMIFLDSAALCSVRGCSKGRQSGRPL